MRIKTLLLPLLLLSSFTLIAQTKNARAEWGEPLRVDMTHSVTKSFLSTVIGLAVQQGLIRSVMDTVAAYIPPIEVYDPISARSGTAAEGATLLYPFASPHNRTLTWDVM